MRGLLIDPEPMTVPGNRGTGGLQTTQPMLVWAWSQHPHKHTCCVDVPVGTTDTECRS